MTSRIPGSRNMAIGIRDTSGDDEIPVRGTLTPEQIKLRQLEKLKKLAEKSQKKTVK